MGFSNGIAALQLRLETKAILMYDYQRGVKRRQPCFILKALSHAFKQAQE